MPSMPLQGTSAVLLLLAGSAVARLESGRGGDPPPRHIPCAAPIRRAPVEFPPSLLTSLAPIPFKMHSGYINVTSSDFLFYWHFESQLDPAAEAEAAAAAPIVLWSNGGPGCSAMEGATTEHGPLVLFDVKESVLGHSGKLSANPYAWNKKAHVVYVDQPRYVGFSCGTGEYVTSSVDAGLDIVQFIKGALREALACTAHQPLAAPCAHLHPSQRRCENTHDSCLLHQTGWKATYPEHAHREWIVAAESYGGHYVPAWTGMTSQTREHGRAAIRARASRAAHGPAGRVPSAEGWRAQSSRALQTNRAPPCALRCDPRPQRQGQCRGARLHSPRQTLPPSFCTLIHCVVLWSRALCRRPVARRIESP